MAAGVGADVLPENTFQAVRASRGTKALKETFVTFTKSPAFARLLRSVRLARKNGSSLARPPPCLPLLTQCPKHPAQVGTLEIEESDRAARTYGQFKVERLSRFNTWQSHTLSFDLDLNKVCTVCSPLVTLHHCVGPLT